jgi:competence protein ComEA
MRRALTGATVLVVVIIAALLTVNTVVAGSPTININTASVEELSALKRVGQAYAARIVAYREANGPFQNPEDIMLVKGIGQKTFDANKDVIVVSTKKKK